MADRPASVNPLVGRVVRARRLSFRLPDDDRPTCVWCGYRGEDLVRHEEPVAYWACRDQRGCLLESLAQGGLSPEECEQVKDRLFGG